jgi:threonine dehydrogenase-like Zn-dependent dehydrogenase
MKAIQVKAPRRVDLIDMPVPELAEDEVLFKVRGCVTCPHWDITLYKGIDIFERPGYPRYPIVPGRPGHEASGDVVAVGSGVRHLKVGDRVASIVTPGEEEPGYYCEYLNRPQDTVVGVPDDVSYEGAASMEMARYVAAYVRALGDVSGKRTGVIGQGPAGLIATQLLVALGAEDVVAIDVLPDRLALAAKVGATQILSGVAEQDLEELANDPLEASVDCTGAASGLQVALDHTRGPVSVFGVVHGEATFGTRHWRSGVYLTERRGPAEEDTQLVLELWRDGGLNTDILVSQTLPFEKYAEGVEALMDRKATKIYFCPA